MSERIDTRIKISPPEGEYDFRVNKVLKMKDDSGRSTYPWEFETFINGELVTHKERFFPSQLAPLLRALGCTEVEPDVFEWEKDEQIGKKIKARIIHEENKKTGKKWPKLRDPKPGEQLPF
jgi:hypothetical protein